MALDTFNPPVAPSPGTKQTPKLRIIKSEFGDGYTQRTRDGLNHIREMCELNWDFLTHEQADEIVAFFRDKGGDTAFLYKPLNLQTEMKWVCEVWSDQVRDDGFRKINATFEQSFSLAT